MIDWIKHAQQTRLDAILVSLAESQGDFHQREIKALLAAFSTYELNALLARGADSESLKEIAFFISNQETLGFEQPHLLVDCLKDKGLCLRSKNRTQNTLLHECVNPLLATKLVEWGADPVSINDQLHTPLDNALHWGVWPMVEFWVTKFPKIKTRYNSRDYSKMIMRLVYEWHETQAIFLDPVMNYLCKNTSKDNFSKEEKESLYFFCLHSPYPWAEDLRQLFNISLKKERTVERQLTKWLQRTVPRYASSVLIEEDGKNQNVFENVFEKGDAEGISIICSKIPKEISYDFTKARKPDITLALLFNQGIKVQTQPLPIKGSLDCVSAMVFNNLLATNQREYLSQALGKKTENCIQKKM